MPPDPSPVRSLRATAHPLRLQMLSLLTGAELSATEVARELGTTQANASYHLRRLLDAGLLEEAGRRTVRGGTATLYRHPFETDLDRDRGEPHQVVPVAEWQAYVRATAGELLRRSAARAPGTPASSTDAELWVAPEVWDEVVAAVEAASLTLHAAARPPRTAGTRRVALTTVAFQTTPPADGGTDGGDATP